MKCILAIETSCDDTSVAIVESPARVRLVLSANQDMEHAPYGGVVPEIASRNHVLSLHPLIEELLSRSKTNWDQIDGIAVTNRPGLVGSLIVGVVSAKALAHAKNLKLIGVNHLEGHLLAPLLQDDQYQPPAGFDFPYLALTVSGGHTSIYLCKSFGNYEVLGSTVDDAAGEAFDKFGKMIGLGFPGGVQVDKNSKNGNPKAFEFPRGMIKEENLMMSFSGLKSASHRLITTMSSDDLLTKRADLCASFQSAVVDVLINKLDRAYNLHPIKRVVITGGVSANSQLREQAEIWANKKGITLAIPPLRYCTDNAAMIGLVGLWRMQKGEFSDLKLSPSPSSYSADFQGLV